MADFAKPYRITQGKRFRLRDIDPSASVQFQSKQLAADALSKDIARLAKLQDKLYADGRWAMLLIFQAMDAAGKDSVIKHVMSGINPQGCEVHSFKAPSEEDLDHDFLWRAAKRLPQRGRIGIFNRSYYEEVLVVRVHPELLPAQKLPAIKDIWKQRFEDINAFERYLHRNGVLIRKFFLHVSKKEQKKRFLDRLDKPDKNWKFSVGDVRDRQRWDEYMHAYEQMVRNTATVHAPWYVVPADNKWCTRLVVASAVIDALKEIDPKYPKVDPAKRKALELARGMLKSEDENGRQAGQKGLG